MSIMRRMIRLPRKIQKPSPARAARQEAARQEAARQDALKREAERQAALARAAPTRPALEPPRPERPTPLPDNRRRRTIFGRTDRDVVAMMYAEGWRQRVEMGAPFDVVKAAKVAPYTNPVITVALRSDGNVDSIVINQSSGVPEIDAAVVRIVQALSPYAPFPRDLAAEVDVLEIRRVWSLDNAVRLFGAGR